MTHAPAPARRDGIAVLIGRFQPFHNGHLALLRRALSECERVVVVLGSALIARSPKHPFSWRERSAMVCAAAGEDARRLSFLPMPDLHDDARWFDSVSRAVNAMGKPGTTVRLVGFEKDATSYYLNRFPAWEQVRVERARSLESAPLRRALFGGSSPAASLAVLADHLPAAVLDYLRAWTELPFHREITRDWLRVKSERDRWAGSPYEPVFVTVDAVVRCSGHVLLIERGGAIGEGLWALPGGFVEPDERLFQAAVRELSEETHIGVLRQTLEDAWREARVFDHPQRSMRGRTITHVHLFDLGDARLPEVRGGDDAASARWVRQADLAAMRESLFEDHYEILDHFLGLDAALPGVIPAAD